MYLSGRLFTYLLTYLLTYLITPICPTTWQHDVMSSLLHSLYCILNFFISDVVSRCVPLRHVCLGDVTKATDRCRQYECGTTDDSVRLRNDLLCRVGR